MDIIKNCVLSDIVQSQFFVLLDKIVVFLAVLILKRFYT